MQQPDYPREPIPQGLPGYPRERIPARFKHQEIPSAVGMTENPDPCLSGYAALGHPIPEFRKTAALEQVRDMVPGCTTDWAMECIGQVATKLERDEPYDAMSVGMKYLDITGVYRLMAVLLTGPTSAPNAEVELPPVEKELP
jgi:hypothetical protein